MPSSDCARTPHDDHTHDAYMIHPPDLRPRLCQVPTVRAPRIHARRTHTHDAHTHDAHTHTTHTHTRRTHTTQTPPPPHAQVHGVAQMDLLLPHHPLTRRFTVLRKWIFCYFFLHTFIIIAQMTEMVLWQHVLLLLIWEITQISVRAAA
jgi:hypothetical protein